MARQRWSVPGPDPDAKEGRFMQPTEATKLAPVPLWVLGFELSSTELRVYIALRSRAGIAGNCSIGSKDLARIACVGQRSALNAIARLRQLEILTTEQVRRPDGSIGSLSYRLANVDPRNPEARIGDGPKMWSAIRRQRHDSRHPAHERTRGDIPDRIRLFVMARDGHRCVKCGATKDLTIDHIHPRSRGGSHSAENLRVLCRSCNSRKGAKCHPTHPDVITRLGLAS